MHPSTANSIIEEYAAREGYPTIEQLNDMKRVEFMNGLDVWPTEYIEVMPNAGLCYELTGMMRHPQTGEMVRSEWGWRMEQIPKTVAFRNTTEGKKHILRLITPKPVRNEEIDINDMIDTASIKVSAANGTERQNKKQTQLNIERMEHLRMLEKSISKGGALRAMYDASLDAHNDGVENLTTNEEAADMVMREKRRKRIPTLLLSWLVMPLYVIIRSFDMFLDGGILSHKLGYNEGIYSGPKVGSNHRILGRLSIPLIVGTFISFVSANDKFRFGAEDYVTRGVFNSGLYAIPVYMLGFIVIKQFLNIPFLWLVEKYGGIAEWASCVFKITDAEDYQFGRVTYTYELQETLGQLIKERQELIKDIKYAIENDVSYSRCDSSRSDKNLSIKALEKEEREAFGR